MGSGFLFHAGCLWVKISVQSRAAKNIFFAALLYVPEIKNFIPAHLFTVPIIPCTILYYVLECH